MEKPNLKLRKFCRVTLFKEQSRKQRVYKKKQNLNHPYSSALRPGTEKDKVLCCDASLRRWKPKVDISIWIPILPPSLPTGSDFLTFNTKFTFFRRKPAKLLQNKS